MAGIACTRVIQMTQQPCFPRCALTVETSYPVNARGPVETSRPCAVVDVFRAVRTCPAVHTDARITSVAVGTGSAVLANGGSH